MLQILYMPRPIKPPTPPNHPPGTTYRYRPILPVTLVGPADRRHGTHAVVDTGSDDCLFPIGFLARIGGTPCPETGHHVTWRGSTYPILYANITLMLADDTSTYTWPTIVAFTPAPIKHSLLGIAGCLQYFDARFRGADRTVELEANWTYPGTK
jgi:hypothetical protein